MTHSTKTRSTAVSACLGILALLGSTQAGEPLTFRDLMQFRQIQHAVIAKDGAWVAYTLTPDRGDGEVVVRATDGDTEHRVPRCASPAIAGDSGSMACRVLPTQQDRDEASKSKDGEDDDGPRNGMALVNLRDGARSSFDEVESFAFSEDGRWIAWRHYKPRKDEKKPSEVEGGGEDASDDEDDDDRPLGTRLVLRNLAGGTERTIDHVVEYAFDEPSRHLAYTVAGPGGTDNGAFVLTLNGDAGQAPRPLTRAEAGRYTHLTWAEESSRLGWLASVDDDLHEPGPADLWMWDGDAPRRLAASADAPEGWRIPSKNTVQWSRDGRRLFFGYAWIDPVREARRLELQEEKRAAKAREASDDDAESAAEPYDPFDVDALIEDRKLDVWHGDDPFIVPHQKKNWDKTEKNRVYLAVAHVDSGKVVRLASRDLPDVVVGDAEDAVLATSDLDYRREVTWDGRYRDVVHVDLDTGERSPVVHRLRGGSPSLSPQGRFVVYWNDGDWRLFDANSGETRNLTADLDVPFADEDDDYPAPDPGYGVADWVEDDSAVLIYDKFDVWRFPTDGGPPVCLTEGAGRREQRRYRVVDLDPERDFVRPKERLLLHGYHDVAKNDGFWRTRVNKPGLERRIEEDKHFRFIAKAEDADRLLYTRESYREFPDLWVASTTLDDRRKLSEANPQIERFAWGRAEPVEWLSADGIPLQGVLIRPGNYDPQKRYPVLVYYYRFFSQRLHHFNQPVVNHRPSFPVYASNGYAVFLPDIRFEIGRPGLSAVKALVPGVQKLVEMGIAAPNAIGLHGHSWSGYQTAHVITQTDIFAAAVAGAPVSNMTSAYSGIRLGSGRARQFQYEQSQSRIGVSLDEGLPLYIENSPVFHARHIETPLLIQFGDQDEAVPWQQGIELYLAMRRLDKEVIFLQYRGEPHHLKQYPNRLDYSIKMKQFFDHHLKGEPAPAWMTEGVPYRGE